MQDSVCPTLANIWHKKLNIAYPQRGMAHESSTNLQMKTPHTISRSWHTAFVTGIIVAMAVFDHTSISAQDAQLPMSFWRTFFARPITLVSPPSNPTTSEKIALGRQLFHDTRLSGDGTRSCATCHQADRGYSDGGKAARATDTKRAMRDTPTLWNIGWAERLFWDGRASTLEAQAYHPISAAHELAANWPEILARLSNDKGYRRAFAKAFPSTPAPSTQTTVAALAAYQRSLQSPITRFDRWIAGDATALTKPERDGFFLFVGKAGCVGCHAGWRFTDDELYDIGLTTSGMEKSHRFKTPTLRMLTTSPPYMHDGRFASLDDVVSHYIDGKIQRPGRSEKMPRRIKLNSRERADLVDFLKSLSAPVTEQ